jgi:hypothetical protein
MPENSYTIIQQRLLQILRNTGAKAAFLHLFSHRMQAVQIVGIIRVAAIIRCGCNTPSLMAIESVIRSLPMGVSSFLVIALTPWQARL